MRRAKVPVTTPKFEGYAKKFYWRDACTLCRMKRRRRLLSLLLLILTLFYLLIRSRWRRVKEKIVIVGGGIADWLTSLAIAADVTILEAQSRVGGRIRTNRSLGFPVELGAALDSSGHAQCHQCARRRVWLQTLCHREQADCFIRRCRPAGGGIGSG